MTVTNSNTPTRTQNRNWRQRTSLDESSPRWKSFRKSPGAGRKVDSRSTSEDSNESVPDKENRAHAVKKLLQSSNLPPLESASPKKPASVPEPPKFELNALAAEFLPPRDPHFNPLGGKLQHFAKQFFCEAYGLEGKPRKNHSLIIDEAILLTNCSERAIREVLYGYSYVDLNPLRTLVPGYPPKVANKNRATQLEQNFEQFGVTSFLSLRWESSCISRVSGSRCGAD